MKRLSSGCTIALSSDMTADDLATFILALKIYNLSDVTLDMSKMSITSIASGAFSGCEAIRSVIIGGSITTIGERAFRACTSLTSVEISGSVTSIGSYAFDNCTSLTIVTIGSAVTLIVSSAFGYCEALTTVYYNGTKDEWGEISIADTSSENGNYYLTQATIICTDGEYEW